MQKGARKWIEYYWNYVNSDKYKEEKIKRKAEYEKATHDSDKEENIQEYRRLFIMIMNFKLLFR